MLTEQLSSKSFECFFNSILIKVITQYILIYLLLVYCVLLK